MIFCVDGLRWMWRVTSLKIMGTEHRVVCLFHRSVKLYRCGINYILSINLQIFPSTLYHLAVYLAKFLPEMSIVFHLLSRFTKCNVNLKCNETGSMSFNEKIYMLSFKISAVQTSNRNFAAKLKVCLSSRDYYRVRNYYLVDYCTAISLGSRYAKIGISFS